MRWRLLALALAALPAPALAQPAAAATKLVLQAWAHEGRPQVIETGGGRRIVLATGWRVSDRIETCERDVVEIDIADAAPAPGASRVRSLGSRREQRPLPPEGVDAPYSYEKYLRLDAACARTEPLTRAPPPPAVGAALDLLMAEGVASTYQRDGWPAFRRETIITTRPRASREPGVCERDVVALKAWDDGAEAARPPGAATLRQARTERQHAVVEIRPRATGAEPALEATCASLSAGFDDRPSFDDWGGQAAHAWLGGQLVAHLRDADGRSAGWLKALCAQKDGCPTAADRRRLFRAESIASGFAWTGEECPPGRTCLSVLLRHPDNEDWDEPSWRVRAQVDWRRPGRPRFLDITFRPSPTLWLH